MNAVANPEFPRRRGANPREGTNILLSPKLHEKKEILIQRGGRNSRPLRSTTGMNHLPILYVKYIDARLCRLTCTSVTFVGVTSVKPVLFSILKSLDLFKFLCS